MVHRMITAYWQKILIRKTQTEIDGEIFVSQLLTQTMRIETIETEMIEIDEIDEIEDEIEGEIEDETEDETEGETEDEIDDQMMIVDDEDVICLQMIEGEIDEMILE